MKFSIFLSLIPIMSQAANYTVDQHGEVVTLSDAAHKTQVSIAVGMGNNAYSFTVNGKPILWTPFASLDQWRAAPVQAGNPLLSPWANRLDQDAFYANGRKYPLNTALGNYRYDAFHHPIHGLVVYAKNWKVIAAVADEHAATVTSRLEFWKHPEWMAQFPFAYAIEMTYRLSEGVLEVHTVVENLSTDTMPLSLGYHTYYQLPGVPRDEWKVNIPATEHVTLSDVLLPTGAITPSAFTSPVSLKGTQLDDVFSGLDSQGEFSVEGGGKKISVKFGPNYLVGVVYAPPGREFICFEPMASITNAFNLAHAGTYKNLQTIAPGAKWEESFWIKPSGF